MLIDLWAKHECLFNSKHPQYLNKISSAKAIDKVIEGLREENIVANAKQIQEKLTKLRNYYGAERRKEESAKVSGTGTDSLYISSWRFYENLHFLKDTLTPRPTVSNLDGGDDEDNIYQINNHPSAKSSRKIRENSRENAECVMAKASKALETIITRYQEAPQERKKDRGEDGLFADMVYEMLSTIPDSREKAMTKLEFQQKLIQLKYTTPLAVPNAPTFNPFIMQPYHGFQNTLLQTGNAISVTPSNHSTSSMCSPVPSPVYPSC